MQTQTDHSSSSAQKRQTGRHVFADFVEAVKCEGWSKVEWEEVFINILEKSARK